MKIKICGLFRDEDIDYVNKAVPDYIGFVFAESKRKVSFEKALEMKKRLKSGIKAVGVFVNSDIAFIHRLVFEKIINIIQLHGDEDELYISSLRSLVGDTPIIKAFSVQNPGDIEKAYNYPSDFILLDNGKGGTGQSFDWKLINNDIKNKMFLAGGINTENIQEALKINPYCIDVSSGAETDGIKDKNKIIQLVEAVRNDGGK